MKCSPKEKEINTDRLYRSLYELLHCSLSVGNASGLQYEGLSSTPLITDKSKPEPHVDFHVPLQLLFPSLRSLFYIQHCKLENTCLQ